MADTKITGLAALSAAPATGDLLPIVDVSDTSMSANGTNKKITAAYLLSLLLGTANTFTAAQIIGFANPDTTGLTISATTGTNAAAMKFANTGGNYYIGADAVGGNRILPNAIAYAFGISLPASRDFGISVNNVPKLWLSSVGNLSLSTAYPTTADALLNVNGPLALSDNQSTPDTLSGWCKFYISGSGASAVLKIKLGDGTIKTVTWS